MSRFASVDYSLPDSLSFATWEPCTDCASGPQPGARALLAYWLEQTPDDATSLGIFNCRNVRGGTSMSVHACGRAIDLGVPVSVAGHRIAVDFLARLAPHAQSLGVQLIIFSRHSGSARNPWPTQYRGVHPHDDHIHLELNGKAAAELTLATLRAVVGDVRDDQTPPVPSPLPRPSAPLSRSQLVGTLPVVRFDKGTTRAAGVPLVQSLLGARRYGIANTFDRTGRPDGIGGPATRRRLEAFQRVTRTGDSRGRPDAIVGARTWTALLGTVERIRFDRGLVRGGTVGTIQALLAAQGHPPARTFNDRGIPDRIGGAHTRDALAAFQRATRTGAPDGSADLIVGPATWAALLRV